MGNKCNTLCSEHFDPYYSNCFPKDQSQPLPQRIDRYHRTLVRNCFHKANEGRLLIHNYTLIKESLTDKDMPHVMREIQYNEHEHKKKSGNNMKEGCNNNAVLEITLGHNTIRGSGVAVLAKAFLQNLRYLDLRMNQIGDRGCQQLSRAKWTTLQQLGLERNQIGEDGCHHLAQADWPSLKWLNIKNNQIRRSGYYVLRNAFEGICYIQCDWNYKLQ